LLRRSGVRTGGRGRRRGCQRRLGEAAVFEKLFHTDAGQIDARWTDAIDQDYRQWLKENEDHLSVPKSRVEEILRDHE
jgi:hypothetical protein